MTTLQTIIFYIFFSMIVAIIAFPRVSLRNHPKLTSEEIASRHSHLQAIQFKYNLLLISGFLIYFLLLILIGRQFEESAFNEYLLIFPALLFIGIYDGSFALITGVFPATSRWNLNRFVYAPQENRRRMAWLQIALAVLGTIASVITAFFIYR